MVRQSSMVEVSNPAAASSVFGSDAKAVRFVGGRAFGGGGVAFSQSRPGSYKQHVIKEDLVVEPIDYKWWRRIQGEKSQAFFLSPLRN